MQLTTRTAGDYLIVTVSERLDAVTTAQFEDSSTSWLDDGPTRLILDMTKLEYVSSAGLRSIMAAAKRAKRVGGSLALCGLSGLVEEVIGVSGFDRILPVYPDVEAALGA